MTRTLAFIQARCSSRRLPGKVLADLGGRPMILSMIDRVARAQHLDGIVLVTSEDESDDELAACVEAQGTPVFRGALDDVLARFHGAATAYPADHYVRLTGDCPLMDPTLIDAVINLHHAQGTDYCSNVAPPTFPDGMDVEVFTSALLRRAHAEARMPVEREHVSYWMYTTAAPQLRMANHSFLGDCSHIRLTVDYPDDLDLVRTLWSRLDAPLTADLFDLLRLLQADSTLRATNPHLRNEGLVTMPPEQNGAPGAEGESG
ncbi:MAG: glycosyltransferase family protein [Brevundimonas sp.]|uniref:glycosyltransferase family protein n=1 Tax=Brevundimonas sp. TaxID=1871086 RepID=UPI00248800B3|nr:glycosyltransferase family protein [Brevundimonas sp.]MDI1325511.1 glycosyltransferase family protein [Brevundimonas sp.]